MGGYGSGRPGSLPTIEDGLKLDLRRLRQQGQFIDGAYCGSGQLVWTRAHSGERAASVGYAYLSHGDAPWFRLKYTTTDFAGDKIAVDEKFELERFPQPFGGHRWYFICPHTRKRAQCLYLPPGATRFRSRHGFRCRLQYRSQSEDQISRMTTQMHKLANRVLEAGSKDWREKFRSFDFPPKPPRMHWRTYEKLYERWDALDQASEEAIQRWLLQLSLS